MSISILNGRVIDSGNDIDEIVDIHIADGCIKTIGDAPAHFQPSETIDADGLFIAPGLIDMRARLYEPGATQKTVLLSECKAAIAAGITSVCIQPDTWPVIDTPAVAVHIAEHATQAGNCKIYPLGALSVGLQGNYLSDMAALKDAGCVGVSNAMLPIRDSMIMRRAMQYANTLDITVFLSACDPWLQGNGTVHEGEVSTRLGLPAIPYAAEVAGVARDLALIETTGVKAHFCGLSSARAVEMIALAQTRGIQITADVNIHNLLLTEKAVESFDTNCHVIPPLRTEEDRVALIEGIRTGVITGICSDHQPHHRDAKLLPFSQSKPGMATIETLLSLTLGLVDSGDLTLLQALACLTAHPARILGIKGGILSPGMPADLCIIDPSHQWQVTEQSLISRGKNTPYLSKVLQGKTRHTILNGEIWQP